VSGLYFLQSIGLIVLAAAAVSLIGRKLQVPSIVSYLVAGLILGPVLGLLTPGAMDGSADAASGGATLERISEIGIVLLLFLVGLELSLKEIRGVGLVAVAAGLGQVVFTAAGGFLLSWVLGFTVIEALFISTALTFSSTVVVVKVLDQKGELKNLYGRIAVGIFLVQDMVVIAVLTVLAGLGSLEGAVQAGEGGEGVEGAAEASISVGEGIAAVSVAFASMAGLLVAVLLASKFVLPWLFGLVARSPRAAMVWSLAWCFVLVEVAHLLGLSIEIGSFLAGLSLAQMPRRHDLRRRVHPLMNFFIAVFFVTLGSKMDFGEAAAEWQAAVVLSLFVLIGNPLIFMFIITRFGYTRRTSFYTSVTVAQISEFSFIFIAMGLSMGMIGTQINSMVAVVGLVTIVSSVYLILYNRQLYELCERIGLLRFFRDAESDGSDDDGKLELQGHIVVVGMNALGRSLVKRLVERGETVLAIDTDPGKLAGLPGEHRLGDISYMDTLSEAGLAEAKLAISALKIEEANRMFVHRCRLLGVPVAVHGFDRSVIDDLERMELAYLIDSKKAADERLEELFASAGVELSCSK
jgi:Kef-type K+ transport system membrane component KefB